MATATGVGRKRGKFQMVGHRLQKIAPINMKKQEHQFVIDGYLIPEVLKQIPTDIKILGAEVAVWKRSPRHNSVITNAQKKCGIYRIYSSSCEGREVYSVFDEISRNALEKAVKLGCKLSDVPFETAYFRYLILSNGVANVRFEHCRKEQAPDDTDLRKKLRVLGCVSGTGQVQSLLTQISAKKYVCTIKEEPVKFIMCKRE